MENLLIYQNEKVREGAIAVGEKSKEYSRLYLHEATERFNRKLEEIEKRCFDPGEDTEELLRATTDAIYEMLSICEEFEKEFVHDKEAIKNARIEFREKTHPILSKSYVMNRTRTWPQGHQGDYKTLESAYRNTPLSKGIGYYLDKYILSVPLADAVRERIVKLQELLREELDARQNPKVLDIACGSCREIPEMVPEIKKSGAHFTCVDLDPDALRFSLNRLSFTDLSSRQIEFRKYNALRMFDHEMAMLDFGMQDVIYSVGYFDYLPDDFLSKLLRTLYLLLNPGGKLIAAFKDANRYRSQDFHWLVDWDGFLQRTEEDLERIWRQAEIPQSALSMSRDRSGVIIFYTVTKQTTRSVMENAREEVLQPAML